MSLLKIPVRSLILTQNMCNLVYSYNPNIDLSEYKRSSMSDFPLSPARLDMVLFRRDLPPIDVSLCTAREIRKIYLPPHRRLRGEKSEKVIPASYTILNGRHRTVGAILSGHKFIYGKVYTE